MVGDGASSSVDRVTECSPETVLEDDPGRPASPDVLHLESFLAYRLSRLAHRVTKALAASYATRHQLTPSEWKLLSIVAEHEPISPTDVAARSTLDRFAVSKTIARMKQQGFVRTSKAPEDRRSIRLTLTVAGRDVYTPIAQEGRRQQDVLLAALSSDDRDRLFRLLDQLDAQYVAEFDSDSRE